MYTTGLHILNVKLHLPVPHASTRMLCQDLSGDGGGVSSLAHLAIHL